MVGSDVANPGLTQCLLPTSAEEPTRIEAAQKERAMEEDVGNPPHVGCEEMA
jgi:hypothetical protein